MKIRSKINTFEFVIRPTFKQNQNPDTVSDGITNHRIKRRFMFLFSGGNHRSLYIPQTNANQFFSSSSFFLNG